MTSIELTDLPHVRSVKFPNLAASRFSAPRLETVEHMTLGQASHKSEAHLPFLSEIGSMTIIGNYSSVRLDGLQRVNEFLSMCTIPNCDDLFEGSVLGPLNRTLPSLVAANKLTFMGKTSNISTPNLTTLGLDIWPISSAEFTLLDTPASLSFPKLAFLQGTFNAQGTIASIDMFSLFNTSMEINIASSTPLNISLPIVGTTAYLGLHGAIEGVDLTNLKGVRTLDVTSSLRLDCGRLDDVFNDLVKYINDEDDWSYASYMCKSTKEKRSQGMSTGLKAGAGVLFGVVGAVI
ncbi:hypothetical protein BDW59DRAFT_161457 [Aspergillus cavernicola]|uniref:GPI-anchored cell wall organization protein Ecm33 n=1 Tax=Aspergillus cavernicola TaxID=176166 RepID=A0ABR4IDG9_9EURO